MATKRKVANYAGMVGEAESAVSAIKDPELRRVAFEKILERLLNGGAARSVVSPHKVDGSKSKPSTRTKKSTSTTKKGPKGRVEELIEEGYFKKQRTIAQVKAELANRGYHIALTSLSGPLQTFTRDKRLRRQKIAANKKGAKNTYAYSNW